MSEPWRWKISEAVERVRTRFDHIGRKTGAPFLALLYPQDVEGVVLREWKTQVAALSPDFEVVTIDVLESTQRSLDDIGIEDAVAAMRDPMPGSNPRAELAQAWVHGVTRGVRDASRSRAAGGARRVVVLERLAALHPIAGPRDVMQQLWDSAQSDLDGPVIVLIPGTLRGPRTYSFLEDHCEFMYRGDLL